VPICTHAPSLPRHLNPQATPQLEAIIQKALEKDRSLRYQSAAELRADLQRLKRETESARALVGAGSARPREGKALPYRTIGATIAVVPVIVAAVLIALNVAGLRDQLLKAVGAVLEPPLRIQ